MTNVKPRKSTRSTKTKSATESGKTRAKRGTKRSIPDDIRLQMIREAAYFRAEKRGFVEGSAHQDWYEAEQEIDRMIVV